MAVAWVAAGTSVNKTTNTTGPSVGLPTGHTTNDVLILVIENFINPGTPPVTDTPAGWTHSANATWTDTRTRTSVFYKIDGGSESAVTPTSASAVFWECQMFAWRGADTTTPFDATPIWAAQTSGTTSNVITAAITTVTNNAKMIWIGIDSGNNGWNTPPAGATERSESTPALIAKFIVADETKVTAGVEAEDVYVRSSASSAARTFGFALRESGAVVGSSFVPKITVI